MRIILLTPNPEDFEPIATRITFESLAVDASMVFFPEEALAATPEFYPCIIISESFTTKKDEIEKLAVKVKAKNPNCKFIIYAVDLFEIDESLFDCVIKATDKNSYELLFAKIKEYIVPKPKTLKSDTLEDFKDKLVKFDTAFKAREKGFYCVTPHRFIDEHNIIGGWIGANKANPSAEDIKNYVNNTDKLLIAPTAGILHEWLKRVHNISVHTKPIYSGNPETGYLFKPYLFLDGKIIMDCKKTGWFSDESVAFEEGLYEALCVLL